MTKKFEEKNLQKQFFEEKKYNCDTTNSVGGSKTAIIGTWTLLGILISEKT